MRNSVREKQIISLLSSGPQSAEAIAQKLYPLGRGRAYTKKQRVYALIYNLRRKGLIITRRHDGKYYLVSDPLS